MRSLAVLSLLLALAGCGLHRPGQGPAPGMPQRYSDDPPSDGRASSQCDLPASQREGAWSCPSGS